MSRSVVVPDDGYKLVCVVALHAKQLSEEEIEKKRSYNKPKPARVNYQTDFDDDIPF